VRCERAADKPTAPRAPRVSTAYTPRIMGADLVRLLRDEQARVARDSGVGVGMPAAGTLYWLAVFVLVNTRPQPRALVLSFILTGAVFPVGILLTRLAGGNLFAKSEAFGSLGGILAGIQIFYWPVIIVVYATATAWTPFAMVVLFGSHFLPYAWLYRSSAYAFLAIAIVVLVTAAVVLARDPLYHVVPAMAAACYGISVAWLWLESRRLANAG
jgi:hypothetical protein